MATHRTRAPRSSQAGIVQIAKRLNISPSTVSRALRPETASLVREDLRKSIRDLAEKLHFSPNPGARMIWDVRISTRRRNRDANFRETMQSISLETSGVIYLGEPLTSEDIKHLRGYRRPLVLTKSALPLSVTEADLSVPVVGVGPPRLLLPFVRVLVRALVPS